MAPKAKKGKAKPKAPTTVQVSKDPNIKNEDSELPTKKRKAPESDEKGNAKQETLKEPGSGFDAGNTGSFVTDTMNMYRALAKEVMEPLEKMMKMGVWGKIWDKINEEPNQTKKDSEWFDKQTQQPDAKTQKTLDPVPTVPALKGAGTSDTKEKANVASAYDSSAASGGKEESPGAKFKADRNDKKEEYELHKLTSDDNDSDDEQAATKETKP